MSEQESEKLNKYVNGVFKNNPLFKKVKEELVIFRVTYKDSGREYALGKEAKLQNETVDIKEEQFIYYGELPYISFRGTNIMPSNSLMDAVFICCTHTFVKTCSNHDITRFYRYKITNNNTPYYIHIDTRTNICLFSTNRYSTPEKEDITILEYNTGVLKQIYITKTVSISVDINNLVKKEGGKQQYIDGKLKGTSMKTLINDFVKPISDGNIAIEQIKEISQINESMITNATDGGKINHVDNLSTIQNIVTWTNKDKHKYKLLEDLVSIDRGYKKLADFKWFDKVEHTGFQGISKMIEYMNNNFKGDSELLIKAINTIKQILKDSLFIENMTIESLSLLTSKTTKIAISKELVVKKEDIEKMLKEGIYNGQYLLLTEIIKVFGNVEMQAIFATDENGGERLAVRVPEEIYNISYKQYLMGYNYFMWMSKSEDIGGKLLFKYEDMGDGEGSTVLLDLCKYNIKGEELKEKKKKFRDLITKKLNEFKKKKPKIIYDKRKSTIEVENV